MKLFVQLTVLAVAALLEVGGDALIRMGLTTSGKLLVAVGFLVLGSYGVVVNLLGLDFSRLLGAYVGVFAAVSFGWGHLFFGERIGPARWCGLLLILAGSAVIHVAGAAAE